MINYILPLLVACTVHLWNATGLPQTVTITTRDKGTLTLTVAPFNEESVSYLTESDVATISGASAAWADIGGVNFNAVEPRGEWLIPSTANTGLMLANPTDKQVFFTVALHRFDGMFEVQSITIAAKSSAAFFVPILFGGDGIGTVVVSSPVALYVQAARCDMGVCLAVPAK